MSDVHEVLASAKNIASNMDDLIQDIVNLDEHEHSSNDCTECEVVYDEGKENHEHDAWGCSDCEEIGADKAQEAISNLDESDLIDNNWELYNQIQSEAVDTYELDARKQRESYKELVMLIAEMSDTVHDIDIDNLTIIIKEVQKRFYGHDSDVVVEENTTTDL
jgi:hypothetical protein